ncbi:MAG TPA: hypothetical protein VNW99_12860 [Cytophagaceae bacterium]|jgi:hypothetical protein|nr:hypothetical protein [Cytophagaceae bacterium]
MKISDLTLPFILILPCALIMTLGVGCETNQEHIKTDLIPASAERKTIKKPEPQQTAPQPVPPDSLVVPDTVESQDRIQKKPEIRIYKRILNFHKKALIT